MSGAETSPEWILEEYRDYLRFLAGTLIDVRLQAKVDLSGIVQQSLLEAHQAQQNDAAGNLRPSLAWLRKILADNLLDEIRKLRTAKRQATREVSLNQALDASSLRLEQWLVSGEPTPRAIALQEEQTLALVAALKRLPDAQREAVVLQFWQGCSVAEIAAHLGRSHLAVAGLLKRGLRQLREIVPHLTDR